jgi:hypothetical protein
VVSHIFAHNARLKTYLNDMTPVSINHQDLKDKPVNIDQREAYVQDIISQRGEYNVFHEYYKELVQALHHNGISRTAYCVNIDALIAALLLKMLWKPYQAGMLAAHSLENAAVTLLLYVRTLGCARRSTIT